MNQEEIRKSVGKYLPEPFSIYDSMLSRKQLKAMLCAVETSIKQTWDGLDDIQELSDTACMFVYMGSRKVRRLKQSLRLRKVILNKLMLATDEEIRIFRFRDECLREMMDHLVGEVQKTWRLLDSASELISNHSAEDLYDVLPSIRYEFKIPAGKEKASMQKSGRVYRSDFPNMLNLISHLHAAECYRSEFFNGLDQRGNLLGDIYDVAENPFLYDKDFTVDSIKRKQQDIRKLKHLLISIHPWLDELKRHCNKFGWLREKDLSFLSSVLLSGKYYYSFPDFLLMDHFNVQIFVKRDREYSMKGPAI